MEIRKVLETAIKTALWELKIDGTDPKIILEHPEDISHGDYSCNIAMVLAKQVAQNPKQLAEKIVAEILERKPTEIEKVEVAGPGFINFYLSDTYFINSIASVIKEGEEYGTNKKLKKEKTVVEFTDPNPFKEFHIGHLMSNAIGESISRIVEANGAKVVRACYQGDVGLHVAKTIWGVQKMIANLTNARKDFFGGFFGTGRDPQVWGKAYALGSTKYEEDESAKKEIIEINKKIYAGTDANINKIYKVGKKVSLGEFEKIYKVLGTHFNHYFFESETGTFGKELVERHIGDIFQMSNGAVIFKGEDYGLHTRVFINSEGLPTYEAKELGLSKIKYDATKYDKSIVVTGNEINDYFKVLLKVMSFIFPDLAAKTSHVSHGMLRLPEGKMSSRTGKVITALSLITDTKEKVLEKMSDREMGETEKKHIAEKVAVAALKYSILKQVTGKDIIFDFDKSLSFEGDSGPYLQYSYARARSILRNAKKSHINSVKSTGDREVTLLEKILYRYPEVVERAGDEYSPHYIATYLIEISSAFNSFYANNKIVDNEDVNSPYKVALTHAFSITLKNGLDLLGIDVVERM